MANCCSGIVEFGGTLNEIIYGVFAGAPSDRERHLKPRRRQGVKWPRSGLHVDQRGSSS